MAALDITVHDQPEAGDALVVDGGLDASNGAAFDDVRPLACFLRDEAGYEMRHTIAGYGPGIQKHWMVHELGADRGA